ncbi:putative sporulation and cell division protein [Kitasatospora setae KM-6054]|uniref:Putative sporulation and cell division protein n=2 Tax=Streptomycetaceae TaxID=2062 RepID=E4N577_KITSK|nr:putative sporulation and cell division protein [Kitasatospora setae KM-6054]
MPAAVFRSFSVTLPESAYPDTRVAARLRFDPALPYGVELAFPPHRPGGEEITWRFGRDLLAEGRLTPAGEGDVRVAPGPDGRILITLGALGPQAERALISTPDTAVAAFLAEAYTEVPPGTETAHLDLAPGLARLLA